MDSLPTAFDSIDFDFLAEYGVRDYIEFIEYKLRYLIAKTKRESEYKKLYTEITPSDANTVRFINDSVQRSTLKRLVIDQQSDTENFLDYIKKNKGINKRHSRLSL